MPFKPHVGDTLALRSDVDVFFVCLIAIASQRHLAQGGGGNGGGRACLDELPPHPRPGLRQPLPAAVPHLPRRAERLSESASVPYMNAMQQPNSAEMQPPERR